ncbi:MAG: DUF2157 domain-containing protein [Marinoscillum sp.]
MSLKGDIKELLEADVIDTEIAARINRYYASKESSSTSRLFLIFGILGAILVGLGVVLIIAHNWDDLPKFVKTIFAFLPLLIGQIIGIYVLLKKRENIAWREGVAIVIFFSVGACIALISQIYQISGDLSGYLLTWSVLVLPLIYVLRSSVASMLFLCWITYYVCEASYWQYPSEQSWIYWVLILAMVPHYIGLIRSRPDSNFTIVHHWLVPLSLVISLGTVAGSSEELMSVAYFSLFGLFYGFGQLALIEGRNLFRNSYSILGALGMIIMLMIYSFDWFWKELYRDQFSVLTTLFSIEMLAALVITGLALWIWVKRKMPVNPLDIAFMAFFLIFVCGTFTPLAMVLVNLLIFIIGISIIKKGTNQNHLGLINFGLTIIAALIVCRFFDSNLSFVIRGVMFVLVGLGFFGVNYWAIKKRTADE